jgi:hypothetical protein
MRDVVGKRDQELSDSAVHDKTTWHNFLLKAYLVGCRLECDAHA